MHLESDSSNLFGQESGKSQSVSQMNMLDRKKPGGDVRTRKSKETRQCWLGKLSYQRIEGDDACSAHVCLEVRGWTLPKVDQALRRGDWSR